MQTPLPGLNNAVKRTCLGLTKRILLSAVFIFPAFYSPSWTAAWAQERKSITALSAGEIMALRRGVAKMKSRDNAPHGSADYRRSWIYWANMHQHFGADCAGPISPTGSGSGMSGVKTFTATNPAETATWCKCEHGTNQFLTWHRMYLWYFERVLQEAADDKNLRLPYWDYETDAHLPAAYRDATYVDGSGHTVPNPLHVAARQPGLNNGTASLSSSVTATNAAMQETHFDPFSSSLEDTPHGAVHCAIVTGSCPFGLMGSVPVAAIDPIFYAHHTNIDRLYECWLRVDEAPRLPNDPTQLNTMFSFIDADGSTKKRRVGDMLTTAQLHYSYAAGGGCPKEGVMAAAPAAPNAPAIAAAEQSLATVGPTRLGTAATTVPLAASPSPQGLAPQGGTTGRTHLVIDGIKYDQAPGGLYDVYLQGPGGQREHVGVINFFNVVPSGSAAHAHHASAQKSFRFDVTDALKQLNLPANAQPSLIFEPATGLAAPQGVAPESVAPQMNAQANVRFDSARLVSGP